MRIWIGALLFLSGCLDKAGPLAMTLEPVVAVESVELRMEPFQREVYPYLQANCALCHSVSVGSAGAFASADVNESFASSVRLVNFDGGMPSGALVQYASNGHCGTPSRCARPSAEWVGLLRTWYTESAAGPGPAASPSPTPSPSASPAGWWVGRQNHSVSLPLDWRAVSSGFTAAELPLQDPRMRLRLEGRRVSATELQLRNPRLILLSGAVVAGDLILSAGEVRGNGDGDFSSAMRDVAGPTPAMGVALLATAQSISIAAAGTELLVSFGELRNSACASLMQFENAVLPALRAQCAGCHQASFFDARTDELVCQMMLTHSLPRDAGNSPILLRPQGAFGHPVIGLSTEERGAIRSWIETEAALR